MLIALKLKLNMRINWVLSFPLIYNILDRQHLAKYQHRIGYLERMSKGRLAESSGVNKRDIKYDDLTPKV